MLRYAFRRVLWVFPSVLGVSILAFFVLSLRAQASDTPQEQLPLFFNVEPPDVRTRANVVLELLTEPSAPQSAKEELARLGGAALPYVVPELDKLSPDKRTRVALALAPVARRMRVEHHGDIDDPKRVVLFWQRFWLARGIEFREATARSAVQRYARYGTDTRAAELRMLDTFALPAFFEALEPPETREDVRRASRLIALMDDMVGRNDRLDASAPIGEATACLERWHRWWLLHRTDYVPLVGATRVAASALETRYGKWVLEAIVLRLAKDKQGRPVLDEVAARAKVTLTIMAFGVLGAYLLAIALGSIGAYYRGRWPDKVTALATLVPYTLSPAGVALAAVAYADPIERPTVVAAIVLALVLVADPTRHQRAALITALARDYVSAARARGAGPWRTVIVHGLRNSLPPVVTRLGLELPVALTACFVVEHVLGIPGLGEATLQAVTTNDGQWLMALSVLAATWAVIALVVVDVGYALLDPRLRVALHRERRRG